jgi:hypothetical protein
MRRTHWIVLGALAALAVGCSGGNHDSPTAPGTQTLAVSRADLLVGGVSVAGQTMRHGHGEGLTARFEAHLMLGPNPAPGYPVWVDYERPMGMMPHQGRFRLYDDGTHGDPIPGDGTYCFEDLQARYACHRRNAMSGEYRYEFYGLDHGGRETERVRLHVRISQN